MKDKRLKKVIIEIGGVGGRLRLKMPGWGGAISFENLFVDSGMGDPQMIGFDFLV